MLDKIKAEDFFLKRRHSDFKKMVIERRNLTNEFTVESIEEHQTNLKKNEEEMKAQLKLTEAVIGNVERNHAFVSKMSPEQLATAAYLHENKMLADKVKRKIKEIQTTLKKYDGVLKLVNDKFNNETSK